MRRVAVAILIGLFTLAALITALYSLSAPYHKG